MVDTTQTTTEKKLTQSDIRGVFLRSNLFQGSWNFERMQALGFCFSMVPAIRRLYPELAPNPGNRIRASTDLRPCTFVPLCFCGFAGLRICCFVRKRGCGSAASFL